MQRTGRQIRYLTRMVQVQCLVLCLVISSPLGNGGCGTRLGGSAEDVHLRILPRDFWVVFEERFVGLGGVDVLGVEESFWRLAAGGEVGGRDLRCSLERCVFIAASTLPSALIRSSRSVS